ncbi:hypothetical protein M8044_000122 [Columbia Basin potato purple top phytoplasma]|uniref:Uncharacterized protein n=1 Tax=Columbia Basin potato purple top phytoplasma TaxID=307134 RepID=A0ABT5L8B7_9MOLU|nr:hypothetical protein [Columbia Basin potato purple top phytoplasma]
MNILKININLRNNNRYNFYLFVDKNYVFL